MYNWYSPDSIKIVIPSKKRLFNERTNEFIYVEPTEFHLEHSLWALSKWESKWHEHFLRRAGLDAPLTELQSLDYIRCMTLEEDIDPNAVIALSEEEAVKIDAYMNDPMTATTFTKEKGPMGNREIMTAERIYHSMIKWGIPFDCQHWHLNRLLALIETFSRLENPKKMSKRDVLQNYHDLNMARKAKKPKAKRKP